MNRIPLLLAAFFCAFWMSCSTEPQDEIKEAVNEDVKLSMLPKLQHSGQGLTFSFQSKEIYNCENVGFQYTIKNTVEDIGIHLLNVRFPEDCDGDQGPAVEIIDVPSAEGYYSIAIDIGESIHNTGLLEITNFSYRIYLYSRSGMTMPYELMYKIPEGTIWGYVAYPQDPTVQVLEIVNNGFHDVTKDAVLLHGYYGYFANSPVYGIDVLPIDFNLFSRSFAFHYLGDPGSLPNRVQEIRNQLPAGTEFKVYTWQGAEL